MRLFLERWFFSLVGGMLLALLLNGGAGFWALKRLEEKVGAPLGGLFVPHLFRPAFTLKHPNFVWKDFHLLSGTLQVHYHPLSLLPGEKFRAQMKGSNLTVRFFKEGVLPHGLSEVKIDWLEADFAFSETREPEVFSFHVHSPELEIHLGEKRRKLG